MSTTVHLLLESQQIPRWQAKAIQTLVDETDAKISQVILNSKESQRSSSDKIRRFFELGLWGPVATYKSFKSLPPHSQPLDLDEVSALQEARIYVTEPVPRDSFGHELPTDAVDVLRDADIAVRMGFGILLGDVLEAPKKGVLSFHHGDLREYRGQPAGFWEFLAGEKEGTITVQRINNTLDGGEIVYERNIDITDAVSWSEVRERLYSNSNDMLAKSLENLQNSDFETTFPEELGELYTLPAGTDVIRYVIKTLKKRIIY